jgi:hypothetical protein
MPWEGIKSKIKIYFIHTYGKAVGTKKLYFILTTDTPWVMKNIFSRHFIFYWEQCFREKNWEGRDSFVIFSLPMDKPWVIPTDYSPG